MPNPPPPTPNPRPASRRKTVNRRTPPPPRDALHSASAQVAAGVGGLREAVARRPRPTRRVGWGLFQDDVRRGRLVSLAGLAILAAIALSIATSPDYVVAAVEVEGSSTLTAGEATQLAGVTGQHLFLVDPQAVAARLGQAAFIKNVSVETALPNHVIIHVEERRPGVIWVFKDNTPYLISDDGILMSRATTLDNYLVIYDQESEPGPYQLGGALERDDAVDTAQRLFMHFPAATGLTIARIEWANSTGGITLVTDTEARILFGDSRLLDDKLRIGAALVKDLRAHNTAWTRLDLRSPERPAVVK